LHYQLDTKTKADKIIKMKRNEILDFRLLLKVLLVVLSLVGQHLTDYSEYNADTQNLYFIPQPVEKKLVDIKVSFNAEYGVDNPCLDC
jgi:uncharacterized protein (UPF0333 family)